MPYVTGIERRAIARGLEKGLEQGLEQGLEKGLEQGLEKGREEGRQTMARKSVLDVLETRFGSLPVSIEESVEEIDDVDRLRSLIKAAATAPDVQRFEQILRARSQSSD